MDLYLEFNGDFLLTASGSIQAATGWDRIRQRIIRRMITNASVQLPDGTNTPADYVFQPEFGFGVGSLVDQPFSADFKADLQRRISQAVLQDSAVDSTIPPSVKIEQPTPSLLRLTIGVTLLTGQSGTIVLEG